MGESSATRPADTHLNTKDTYIGESSATRPADTHLNTKDTYIGESSATRLADTHLNINCSVHCYWSSSVRGRERDSYKNVKLFSENVL